MRVRLGEVCGNARGKREQTGHEMYTYWQSIQAQPEGLQIGSWFEQVMQELRAERVNGSEREVRGWIRELDETRRVWSSLGRVA